MFRRGGQRGHPLLAGAVIVGASRSAARREVGLQSQYAAESQRAAERSQREEEARVALAVDRSRREDEERERKTARAIDEALARERSRGRSPLPGGMQGRSGGYQPAPSYGVSSDVQGQGAPPAYLSNNIDMEGLDDMREMGGRHCTTCGSVHTWEDKYCAGCGCKLAVVVPMEQGLVVANSPGNFSPGEEKFL